MIGNSLTYYIVCVLALFCDLRLAVKLCRKLGKASYYLFVREKPFDMSHYKQAYWKYSFCGIVVPLANPVTSDRIFVSVTDVVIFAL